MKLNLSTFLVTLAVAEAATFNGEGCVDYDPTDTTWHTNVFHDDSTVLDVHLGFPFTFGGVARTNVDINSNGHILFDSFASSGRFSFDGDFTGSSEPVIAPFWADVDVRVHGNIRYKQVGSDKFVILWQEVSEYGGTAGSTNTFEIVLSSDSSGDSKICFCYETMDWARSGDVGISQGTGSGFLLGTFDTNELEDQFQGEDGGLEYEFHGDAAELGTYAPHASAFNGRRLVTFEQGDDAWHGLGSAGNGLGHLNHHSYCFDPSIVVAADPACAIISTNDVTVVCLPDIEGNPGLIGGNPGLIGGNPGRIEANSGPVGPGGDPHFTTWNKEHYEYHGQCDLTLIKDAQFAERLGLDVQIRTKIVRYWSYIKSAAIKIGNDILEIEGSADADDADAHYWVNFEYQGELDTFAGFTVTQTLASVYKRQYIIDLSPKYPGASISVQLYKEFVRVKFNGDESVFGNAVGLLGDYKTGDLLARDGSTIINAFTDFGDEWQVLPSEPKLFHEVSHPQFPELCIKPEDPRGERKRRLDEADISIEQAEAACATLKDPLSIKDCVYDVLATQDMNMVGAF